MSIALAQAKYSFGLKGDVSGSVWYLDEQNVLYPSGANVVLFNVDQRQQRFLPCSPGGGGITALAVSPNRRYVAVAEKRSDRPTVTVFDVTTLRRRKVLSSSEVTSQEFVCLAFSPDSKYLVTQVEHIRRGRGGIEEDRGRDDLWRKGGREHACVHIICIYV